MQAFCGEQSIYLLKFIKCVTHELLFNDYSGFQSDKYYFCLKSAKTISHALSNVLFSTELFALCLQNRTSSFDCYSKNNLKCLIAKHLHCFRARVISSSIESTEIPIEPYVYSMYDYSLCEISLLLPC